MRRVAAASLIGGAIEFYDFFIYGTAAALIFGPLFFPALGGAAGTAAAFATFGVAFFFRPVGSILFGHLGDRIGRKRTLVGTLVLMGVATVSVGLMPTPDAIGVVAPILLIVARILQGLAVGGEWAGAALLTTEYAPRGKRGMYSMFPQFGSPVGLTTGYGTFLVSSLWLSEESFKAWGWRVPFIFSIVLVVVGLYIRLRIEETPVFRKYSAQRHHAKVPFVDALRYQWRQVLLAGGTLTMTFGVFYISTIYMASYAGNEPGAGVLGMASSTIFVGGMIVGITQGTVTVFSALYSDRFGRRRVLLVGTIFSIFVGPLAFAIMQPGSIPLFLVGVFVFTIAQAIPWGPAAAFVPELFHTRYRYSGAGMGYNMAGILGGALPLLIAPPIAARFGGFGVGLYLTVLGLISTVCVLLMRETKNVDIELSGNEVHPSPRAQA